MANLNGKRYRTPGQNRHALRRHHRHSRAEKAFRNNKMSPAEYKALKLSQKKRLRSGS